MVMILIEPESVFLTIDITDLYCLYGKPDERFSFLLTFNAPAPTPTNKAKKSVAS